MLTGWINNFVLGRDFVSISARETPRAAFERFASRPRPAAPAADAAPAKLPAADADKKPEADKAAEKPAEAVAAKPAAGKPAAGKPAPARAAKAPAGDSK